ncbi:NAD(P)-dependent oxidoreductase [Streptomyces flaveolus]|uniref:NAD(P)-dependent oxidoreductase n=1 Tax=Streptomyces flaveolus TaxID=67297 RepID=UPI0038005800
MENLAIVGCGEVGRGFALGAVQAGWTSLSLCDVKPAPAAQALSAEHGLPLHEAVGPWLKDQGRVWSCVTGDVALAVAEQVMPHMTPGALFLDLSTASPEAKREGAVLATGYGLRYAEGAIMGAVGLTGLRTPLLVAGPDAEAAVDDLDAVGAPARALENGRAGDAVALKLLRTVMTKGLEALGVECLIAAERQGVREELYRVLGDIDEAGFIAFLNSVVRSHVTHAARRGQEIGRAADELDGAGLHSLLLGGARERFELTASALHTDPPPADTGTSVDAAVSWLLDTTLRTNRTAGLAAS